MDKKDILKLKGSSCFRARIILSTLSGRPIYIHDIRSNDQLDTLGLFDYEISFLKLIESITNGSIIEINDTGTSLFYQPGIIVGGKISFDCPLSKSIGYFLEFLLPLAPFAKSPLQLTLTGITNDKDNLSVDFIRMVSLSVLRKFGIKEGLEIKILKRGWPPNGGGQILFNCPIIKSVSPIQFVTEGKIKKIRGLAACSKMSSQVTNRLAECSRTLLNQFISDVQIYTDIYKGNDAGHSPGFSLIIVAETTTGAFLSAEGIGQAGVPPEDVASRVTKDFLFRISEMGCFDPSIQWLVLLFMALASEDVSMIKLSSLTPFSIDFIREMKSFFSIVYKLKEDVDRLGAVASTLTATCVGLGYLNYSMRST